MLRIHLISYGSSVIQGHTVST